MPTRHCYLFTLAVVPLTVGTIYEELPLHCTLMHRFWSALTPKELADKVHSLFDTTPQLALTAYEHTKLGPKHMAVSLIKITKELDALNMQLYQFLNKLKVEYTAPQWVGKGHVFHVTEREDARLAVGGTHVSKAIYLIEVNVAGYEGKRIVREWFELGGFVR
jgi:hypothetical protein